LASEAGSVLLTTSDGDGSVGLAGMPAEADAALALDDATRSSSRRAWPKTFWRASMPATTSCEAAAVGEAVAAATAALVAVTAAEAAEAAAAAAPKKGARDGDTGVGTKAGGGGASAAAATKRGGGFSHGGSASAMSATTPSKPPATAASTRSAPETPPGPVPTKAATTSLAYAFRRAQPCW
jgi:hypothetical protein